MNKKSILLILLIILVLGIVAQQTYAYYSYNTNISVTSVGSSIKCDAELQEVTGSEKSIFGYSEFKVVVKNTENNELTGEAFDYTLTFEDTNNSNSVFGYNNEFNQDLTIHGFLLNDQATSDSYIIQVKSSDGLSTNANYKVNLNCVQQY